MRFKKGMIGVALFTLLSGTANAQLDRKSGMFVDWGFGMNGGISPCQVSGLPESARNIPQHEDDFYNPRDIAPIKDEPIGCQSLTPFASAKIGARYSPGNNEWNFGAFYKAIANMENHTVRRNYSNYPGTDKRGYGAALTFYGFTTGGGFIPGFFVEYVKNEFMDGTLSERRFKLYEYSAEASDLFLDTGWDRFDGLQIRDHIHLSKNLDHFFKIGFGNQEENSGSVKYYAGVKVSHPLLRSATGEQTKITPKFGVFAGLELSAK